MFNGKTAIVTGAARGIGRTIGTRFLAKKCRVAAFDVDREGLEGFRADAEKAGWDLTVFVVDVADEKSVIGAGEQVLESFGQIDILVNNAGIVRDRLLMRMEAADWDAVVKVNLTGAFYLTRTVIRSMMKARKGRIINISSVVALMGNVGQTNYAASKAGLIGFTRSLALEVASRGITVNAVAPGFIDTDMTRGMSEEARSRLIERIPAGRLGTAEDVAVVVEFLATEPAGYITGQVIGVNGGMHLG